MSLPIAGYNWRNTLSDYAAISGVFAGFGLTIIVFVLGWSVADSILLNNVTWGEAGVLVMGIASGLFVAAAEFFLLSKECDVWSIPEKFEDTLPDFFKQRRQDWSEVKIQINAKCRMYSGRGKICYNYGIFAMFIGIWFVISPYNIAISTLIFMVGIGLELYEWFSRTPKG